MSDLLTPDPLEPLEPREEQYCQEYLLDLNQTQAAIRAGYSETSARSIASRLMTKDNILARITTLKAARAEKLQVDSTFVLKRLLDISARCMEAKPAMEFDPVEKCMVQKQTAEGELLFEFNSLGATKAIELVGKHIGFFEEHNKQKAPASINYNDLSPQALAEIIRATTPNA
jgi:phage terminase small subunit